MVARRQGAQHLRLARRAQRRGAARAANALGILQGRDQLAALHQQFVHRRVNGVDLTTDLLDTDASPCHDFARYHPLSRPRRGGVENAGYSYGREVAKSKKTLTLLGSDT